ncbi:OmpA family protein [uncultured Tateyamaria sp.]|uniref:OmpA family protein n=1 Tax=uncultured Tateyamaria sp. TaxID=455651 RepID=UPI00260B12AC|nr:OmpA family protein [uncultured Tateyamaria sp.]
MAGPLAALELALPPNAQATASRDRALAQEAVPDGPYVDGNLSTRLFEGPITHRAYRIPSSGLTPLQILAPLRAQLDDAGYKVLLDCDDDRCGGFDFRFAINVLPAPNMYVNIRDYHFLSAETPDGKTAVALLASAAAGSGYLQVIQVGTAQVVVPDVAPSAPVAAPSPPTGDLAARLLRDGHAVLQTLDFAVGSTALSSSQSPELAAIAAIMQDRPALRIAVVGHTDTVGALEANIAVSRARAASVRTALINGYDVAPDRIEAGGMGYLAPIASNLSREGREANRRVEVVVIGEDG